MPRKALLLSAVGLAVCMCAIIAAFAAYQRWQNWSLSVKSESVRLGNEVVRALRAYYSDHDAFPDDLDALVPTYLPSIPKPTAGSRCWRYTVEPDKQVFSLQFSTPSGYPSMNYCSFRKDAEWYEDN
jgi:hypothetical protein